MLEKEIWSTQEGCIWAERVSAAMNSGMKLRAWCREQEVPYKKLIDWKWRFKQAGLLDRIAPRVQAATPQDQAQCRYLTVERGSERIRLALGHEYRLGQERLINEVIHTLKLDPQSGDLFVFARTGNKALYTLQWKGNGFRMGYRELERGTFFWPTHVDEKGLADLTLGQLTSLLGLLE